MKALATPLRAEVQSLLVEFCEHHGYADHQAVALRLLHETLKRRMAKRVTKLEMPLNGERPVLVFPCLPGKSKHPKEWPLYPHRLSQLQDLYPHLDVMTVIRVAYGWILSHQPKTYDGMLSYLTGFLAREQNRAPQGAPQRRPVAHKQAGEVEDLLARSARLKAKLGAAP